MYSSSTFTRPDYVVVSIPAPPISNFIGSPIYGSTPLLVGFADLTLNTPTAWNWSFGDEHYSTEQNPMHTYTASGIYPVSLTTTNAYGSNTSTKLSYISVSEVILIANMVGSPTYGVVPLTVSFTDVSNAQGSTITAWNWSFGDGEYSTEQNPSHTYTGVGSYTVMLTVGNAYGFNSITRPGYINGYAVPITTPTTVPPVPTLPPVIELPTINQSIIVTAEIGEKYINWRFKNTNRSAPLPVFNIYIDDRDTPAVTNYTGETFLMSDLAPGERHNIRVYDASVTNETNVSAFLAKATAKTSNAGYEIMYFVALNLLLVVLLFILKDLRYLILIAVFNIVVSLLGMSLTGGVGLSYYIFIGVAILSVIMLLISGIPKLREEIDWL